MRDDEYAEARQRMVAEIAAETIFSSGETGRAALGPRVLDALGRVKGAYSLVFLTHNFLIAARDPQGFRRASKESSQ